MRGLFDATGCTIKWRMVTVKQDVVNEDGTIRMLMAQRKMLERNGFYPDGRVVTGWDL